MRRRACPEGYCPKSQLCGPCFTALKASGKWAEMHKDCAAGQAAFVAQRAEEAAHPDRYPRAAWGTWHTKTDEFVLVLTQADTFLLIPPDEYEGAFHTLSENAIPWTPESGIELPPGQTKRVA